MTHQSKHAFAVTTPRVMILCPPRSLCAELLLNHVLLVSLFFFLFLTLSQCEPQIVVKVPFVLHAIGTHHAMVPFMIVIISHSHRGRDEYAIQVSLDSVTESVLMHPWLLSSSKITPAGGPARETPAKRMKCQPRLKTYQSCGVWCLFKHEWWVDSKRAESVTTCYRF